MRLTVDTPGGVVVTLGATEVAAGGRITAIAIVADPARLASIRLSDPA
ncbi:hypothetical protein [Nonomuraea guangzhouensis]|uniref:Uncharacterized protein n=1 Tax=Nonomuraea guangzhouensis TaxID=1291555 RepID=A0ABW4GHM7_9ACTN|nr:hypothetical protein [Nonomuraea guangzhouensis]